MRDHFIGKRRKERAVKSAWEVVQAATLEGLAVYARLQLEITKSWKWIRNLESGTNASFHVTGVLPYSKRFWLAVEVKHCLTHCF